jgi:alpha-glucan,water dikinase
VPEAAPEARRLRYGEEPLILNRKRRDPLLESIGELGLAVERALGGAQDIEGAVKDGRLYAVQTRPQVGL